MPDVAGPETLPTLAERMDGFPELKRARLPFPFDLRYVDDPPWMQRVDGPRVEGGNRVWMRATGTLPDDPLVHVCAMTFASDLTLLDAVLVRQGVAWGLDPITGASLDHAMWFHRPFRADEWFLYESESPSASGSRGLAAGKIFTQDGRHVATVMQEGLLRVTLSGQCSSRRRSSCPVAHRDGPCPRWDSNPHWTVFETASSTGWDTGA